MTESDVAGWVFESTDGKRWAVQANTKEDALRIFTGAAPSKTEVIDERTIPSCDAGQYQLETGKAVLQRLEGAGRG